MINRIFSAQDDDDSPELLSVYHMLITHLKVFISFNFYPNIISCNLHYNAVHSYYIPILEISKLRLREIK